jgi:membrane fusion protein (multidrug efflux system)
MFQLDPRQAQAAVEQAQGDLEQKRALLAQAQIDINRYTPLVAEKAVSQAELDRARSLERSATAQMEGAQAALDNARLNRGWTTVVSPISGIAGIAKVAIGDLMTPNTVMTTVSSVDPIYVDFSVAEQDYLRLSRDRTEARAGGRNLELTLGDGTVFPHPGHVIVVNREVDSRTGTIQVRAEFPNAGNLLRPGQYARIRAVTESRKNALLIPQQAVSELQGTYQVGVVDAENKVAIRTVKLGPQFGDMWVVESGIKPGEKVVVDGLQRLRDGMTVAPTPFVDTQANAVKGGE